MARNFLPSQQWRQKTNMKQWRVVDVIGRLVCSMHEPWEGRTGLWTGEACSHLTIQALSLTSTWMGDFTRLLGSKKVGIIHNGKSTPER